MTHTVTNETFRNSISTSFLVMFNFLDLLTCSMFATSGRFRGISLCKWAWPCIEHFRMGGIYQRPLRTSVRTHMWYVPVSLWGSYAQNRNFFYARLGNWARGVPSAADNITSLTLRALLRPVSHVCTWQNLLTPGWAFHVILSRNFSFPSSICSAECL